MQKSDNNNRNSNSNKSSSSSKKIKEYDEEQASDSTPFVFNKEQEEDTHSRTTNLSVQQRKVTSSYRKDNNLEEGETISLVSMSGTSVSISGTGSTQGKSRQKRGWFGGRGNSDSGAPRSIGINDNLEMSTRHTEFPPNVIRNQKYSFLSFLPIVLFNQVR